MSQTYVPPFLFAGLAALGVGNTGASSVAGQACGDEAFRVFDGLCEAEEHLHEDQFCERRPRSRVDRFANESFHRGSHAIVQGRLIALDQREQSGHEQVWLGRGYGVFSVSESGVAEVCAYIANQEEHHRKRNFVEELRLFVERYGLEWRKD
jgi:hypothetical protein